MVNKFLFIIILAFTGCKPEKFDTLISIELISGITVLKTNPSKILIKYYKSENGIANDYSIIDTIITDSFGKASKIVKLGKLNKNTYYTAELIESKWQLPAEDQERRIVPEVENRLGIAIKPKWRIDITLEDSVGRFKLEEYECYNSQTKTYRDFAIFDSLSKYSQQFLYSSAPSYSHIFVKLRLRNRNTKELKIKQLVFDSEKFKNIWIKY